MILNASAVFFRVFSHAMRNVFCIVWICELLLKLFCLGWLYCKDPWNYLEPEPHNDMNALLAWLMSNWLQALSCQGPIPGVFGHIRCLDITFRSQCLGASSKCWLILFPQQLKYAKAAKMCPAWCCSSATCVSVSLRFRPE